MIALRACVIVVLLVRTRALPNFVFLLTDDQDLLLRSVNYMPKTTTLVANQGRTFTNFYVNSPICCPSRSSILTGRYAHNVKVYNNSVNGGCSSTDWQQNAEPQSIASILKTQKNYTTFYAGKYLNQYGAKANGGVQHVPTGYDWWVGLEGNSKYYNYTLSINGTGHFFQDDYLTDQLVIYGLDFLNQKQVIEGQFFMILAPPACHAPFTPAPRHSRLFPNVQTPRNTPFNTTPINKHWLMQMPPTNLPSDVTILDDIYRNRLRTLQAVDDLVEAIVTKLTEVGVLDNTYFLVTSDNGFHIGQFAQPWDKRQPYESDVHVPFMIRGPNVPPKTLTNVPASAVDIMPTILDLAGIQINTIDGQSFKSRLFDNETDYDEYILLEYWGESDKNSVDPLCHFSPDSELSECDTEAWCKCQDSRNNTYSCVLALSNTDKFKLCVFATGFVESYDLIKDPYELNNLQSSKEFVEHYSSLEMFKNCQGHGCMKV